MRYAPFFWIIALLGCEGGVRSKAPSDLPPAGHAEWAFAPVAMRFHPFTALVSERDGQAWFLDARIELLDFTGDATKGLGSLRVELYAVQPSVSRAGQDQRLEMWQATLATPQEHQARYDTLTRSYHFRLQLNHPPPRQRDLKILATFTDTRGKRLTTQMQVAEPQ